MSTIPLRDLLNALTTSDAQNAASNFLAILKHSPKLDPSAENSYALTWAIKQGHRGLIETLLHDQRIDINANEGYAFLAALQQRVEIFNLISECPKLDLNVVALDSVKGALRCAVAFGTTENLRAFLARYPWHKEKFNDLLQFAYKQLQEPAILAVLLDTMGPTPLNALDLFGNLCAVQDVNRVKAILPFIEQHLKDSPNFAQKCRNTLTNCDELDTLFAPFCPPPPPSPEPSSTLSDLEASFQLDPVRSLRSDQPTYTSQQLGESEKQEPVDSSVHVTVPEHGDTNTTAQTTVTLPDGTCLKLHIHITMSTEQD